ncbi:hypothetical protein BC941DRAFT_421030 [Chlamydoabsidia padenii]|nr:hypothetical protein BC941DRAFT_421030 [Chlamydoabsidia padenii]
MDNGSYTQGQYVASSGANIQEDVHMGYTQEGRPIYYNQPQGNPYYQNAPPQHYSAEEQAHQSLSDIRSIYVGQVDYGTTPEELQAFFEQCGPINRVTILRDKYTGHPKGYGFIEFSDESSVAHALSLDQAEFRGRQLKVTAKRANVPGLMPRGGRGRGRGGHRGGGRGYAPPIPVYGNPTFGYNER